MRYTVRLNPDRVLIADKTVSNLAEFQSWREYFSGSVFKNKPILLSRRLNWKHEEKSDWYYVRNIEYVVEKFNPKTLEPIEAVIYAEIEPYA